MSGQGEKKDVERAVVLFQKACDLKHAEACIRLASLYYEGKEVPKDLGRAAPPAHPVLRRRDRARLRDAGRHDPRRRGRAPRTPKRAAQLFQKACDGGEAAGCGELGVAYREGRGVPRDVAKAAALFTRGCDGGSMAACANLGLAHETGAGVARDLAKAASLFTRACEAHDPAACHSVGLMHKNGTGVARNIARAGDAVQGILRRPLRPGLLRAGHRPLLGPRRARGTSRRPRSCTATPATSATCGAASASATMYAGGGQVAKDAVGAFKLFKEACDGGDVNGCVRARAHVREGGGHRPRHAAGPGHLQEGLRRRRTR